MMWPYFEKFVVCDNVAPSVDLNLTSSCVNSTYSYARFNNNNNNNNNNKPDITIRDNE